ncbi:MAG TPA: FtsX-like permease family protein [Candidatus Dormibacteraeota bacterium]|nr:FtsX-like permease family protein [Candidatus Dormibacteraeota bacterium]
MPSNLIAQRTREIGIRIALGARNLSVLSLVMKEGLVLVAVGTIIGMGGAWMASRLLAAMVKPHQWSYLHATVGTVSSTSTSNPVDPIVALRQE